MCVCRGRLGPTVLLTYLPCTGIAEVVCCCFCFSDFFVRNCDGLSLIRSFIHSLNIFIYSISCLHLHGIQWNLDLTKYQGTGEIGSLYVRTVTSSHCSIFFKRSGARFSKVPVT